MEFQTKYVPTLSYMDVYINIALKPDDNFSFRNRKQSQKIKSTEYNSRSSGTGCISMLNLDQN